MLDNVMHGISGVLMKVMPTKDLVEYRQECHQILFDEDIDSSDIEWNDTERRLADEELERRRR